MLTTEKTELFESMSVPKAVATLAVPTIISQLVVMVYNLADTFFVGQTNDPNQVAAITLVFPAFMTLTALANLFGIGGGSLISRALGERNYSKAKKTAAFSFYTAIAVTLCYSILILIFKEPFLNMLGATELTREYAGSYLIWVLVIGGVPTMLNMLLGHLVRAEGAARQASIGMALGGILNIILDPIFILPFGFNLNITGAAIATMLSNTAATVYFLIYLYRVRRKSMISIRPRDFGVQKEICRSVAVIGLPAAMMTFLAVISNMVLNNLASGYGERAIAAIGIAKKVDMLPLNVTLGLAQGVVPLLGYNYAARNYERMKAASRFTRLTAVGFSVMCIIVFEIFAPQVVRLFIKDAATVKLGASFLRILCLMTPFLATSFLVTTMFQASGQSKQALVLSTFRKGTVDIPLMFLMNALFPLYGLLWVQPMVDTASAALAITLNRKFLHEIQHSEQQQISC